ncbi:MAG: hypothetical protein R2748_31410 [Bryobacterales bacterium]
MNSIAEELNSEASGAHQRRDQAAYDDALHTGGQQRRDQQREGGVGIRQVELALLAEREGDHAGHEEDEDRRELQVAAEDRSAARLALILARQHALDDVLVRTPVPEADDGRGEEDARPGEGGVFGRANQVQHRVALGRLGCFHDARELGSSRPRLRGHRSRS